MNADIDICLNVMEFLELSMTRKKPQFKYAKTFYKRVQGTCKEDNLGKNRVKWKKFSTDFLSLLSLCVRKFLAGQLH